MTTEERLKLLEAHIEVQEEILTAMQAERIEAIRLDESVNRLGLNASALGEALLTVDQNQQILTRLGRELQEVKDTAVTAEQLDEVKVASVSEEQVEERAKAVEEQTRVAEARSRNRMIAIGVVLLLVSLLGLGGGLRLKQRQDRQDYENCLQSQRTLTGVRAFLESVSANSTVPAIKDSATNLLGAFRQPEPCERP